MACLQMILAARGERAPGIEELGERCTRHGGYRGGAHELPGPLIYAGFVAFASAELGLRARVAAPLALDELLGMAAGEEVVLASVSAEICSLAPAPERRGGHLVLVYDADPRAGSLRFHDPAGGAGVRLAAAEFERFFAGRGIAVTLARSS